MATKKKTKKMTEVEAIVEEGMAKAKCPKCGDVLHLDAVYPNQLILTCGFCKRQYTIFPCMTELIEVPKKK